MKKADLSRVANNLRTSVAKRSPQILIGVGIAGMVTATVLAVKATPKALALIEEAENQRIENGEVVTDEFTTIEKVKVAWKPYIPAAVTGVLSIACLVGSNSVSTRRTAALATAYKISETALNEYKDAIVETVGEKKAEAIKDKVAEKRIKENPVDDSQVIITDKGNTLFYDTTSGRYFRSDIDKIKKVENKINYVLRNENYTSLNTLYEMFGLAHTSIGNELGWSIDRDGYLEIDPRAQIADNGEPCIVLDYNVSPKYDYDKFGY